ncbi:MAG: hypothetical protein GY925_13340 [Actinomycetia bacterium]|nr:hypothetical protein [Actinomycetes bacterium]
MIDDPHWLEYVGVVAASLAAVGSVGAWYVIGRQLAAIREAERRAKLAMVDGVVVLAEEDEVRVRNDSSVVVRRVRVEWPEASHPRLRGQVLELPFLGVGEMQVVRPLGDASMDDFNRSVKWKVSFLAMGEVWHLSNGSSGRD